MGNIGRNTETSFEEMAENAEVNESKNTPQTAPVTQDAASEAGVTAE